MITLDQLTETQREAFRTMCQQRSQTLTRSERRDMLSVAVALRSVLPVHHPLLAMPMLPNAEWNRVLMIYLTGVCCANHSRDLNEG